MVDLEKAIPIVKELSLESDRALVLITGAHVENELTKHLEYRLLPKLDKKDELLHRADFETKIILAYRTGVITEDEFRVYTQLRQLRNKCAHDVSEQSFQTDQFQHRLKNIMRDSPKVWQH
ncbi:hypothetical protein [Pseudoalteromonas luteoviolacea]|uniref:DUF4145 domain-containing protein n=1 Tax=Pseudoalteromonas luteoviolacea S4054 TaxID=1129367 RepID=A0A0F6AHE2_9GAMM|nr:hypothetical protein [Pseudoalteromonas luteoviolacea]AOT08731.1 hypothetical protein S4054249_13090 [Pseudoalteromonas luteoviolacea]AOT13646.1 hypothetical protein S40542_13065 [Pseudoalteromonas luteoviolacea]AOT18559.1 hypothetical protein S4054_13065 [Pseudoalteromonas luteoviolacea]KKE85627.1 hypothetical protein N479_25520 [Pseudoalteromonas luteoviolacea S4054]KZN68170.1 hypothetical protein N481_23250 [Pseudoalteromonas luteoviolacea S4047-1]